MDDTLERRPSDMEFKLILLYILSACGPCTDMTMLDFVTEKNLMNYFDLMINLTCLERERLAVSTLRPSDRLYEITAEGQSTLALFQSRIPASRKEILEQMTPLWQEKLNAQKRLGVSITRRTRGDFEVQMRISDLGQDVLTLSVALPTREMADTLAGRWNEMPAGKIYDMVFDILKGEGGRA